jgi:hypothetical protein
MIRTLINLRHSQRNCGTPHRIQRNMFALVRRRFDRLTSLTPAYSSSMYPHPSNHPAQRGTNPLRQSPRCHRGTRSSAPRVNFKASPIDNRNLPERRGPPRRTNVRLIGAKLDGGPLRNGERARAGAEIKLSALAAAHRSTQSNATLPARRTIEAAARQRHRSSAYRHRKATLWRSGVPFLDGRQPNPRELSS